MKSHQGSHIDFVDRVRTDHRQDTTAGPQHHISGHLIVTMAHPGRRGTLSCPGKALRVGVEKRPADITSEASEGHLSDVPVPGEQVLNEFLTKHLERI